MLTADQAEDDLSWDKDLYCPSNDHSENQVVIELEEKIPGGLNHLFHSFKKRDAQITCRQNKTGRRGAGGDLTDSRKKPKAVFIAIQHACFSKEKKLVFFSGCKFFSWKAPRVFR